MAQEATGRGAFRRRIHIWTPASGQAAAELEDDFHHFRTDIEHDGTRVVQAEGTALRHPWTTCADAGVRLADLAGVPLSITPLDLARHTPPRSHCTHLFDLAGLAIAHAGARRHDRTYDITVPDRHRDATTATLVRDGEVLLTWEIAGREIVSPPPFAGQQLRGGFIAWAVEQLDADTAEAAIVLRRAADISIGRIQNLDIYDDPTPLMGFMDGSCYTFRWPTAGVARRVRGSMRDFSDTPDLLLREAEPTRE